MESNQLIRDKMFARALSVLEQLAMDTPANRDVFKLLGFAPPKTERFIWIRIILRRWSTRANCF